MNSNAVFADVFDTGASNHIWRVGPLHDPVLRDASPEQRVFQIEAAHAHVPRQSANQLLKERYGWRGYKSVSLPDNLSGSHFSLSATREGKAIGTISVGFEDANMLNCEEAFPDEVETLRASRRRLCEFTRLAVDQGVGTRAVLAALFHVAYIVAHRLRGVDTLLMEVNPRHVRYYERMLGARVFGSERMNTKVNAPAVLLSIEFEHVKSQIEACAGRPESAATERSLYTLAFTRQEEAGIIARLTTMQAQQRAQRAASPRPFMFRLPSPRLGAELRA